MRTSANHFYCDHNRRIVRILHVQSQWTFTERITKIELKKKTTEREYAMKNASTGNSQKIKTKRIFWKYFSQNIVTALFWIAKKRLRKLYY